MKDIETKLKVVELRVKGKSVNAIAEIVGVRRQTVAGWLIDFQEEVENLKAIELDALHEAFVMSKQERLEQLAARLAQIRAAIDERGFSDVPTEKLLQFEEETRCTLENESSGATVRSDGELKEAKADRQYPRPSPADLVDDPYVRVRQNLIDMMHLVTDPAKGGNGRKRTSVEG